MSILSGGGHVANKGAIPILCSLRLYSVNLRFCFHPRSARNESWRISGSLKYLITPCGLA